MSDRNGDDHALDSVDRRMLAILQSDGRISKAALADRLHLSPSPCLRRLRTLERDGVISGYRPGPDRPRRRRGRPRTPGRAGGISGCPAELDRPRPGLGLTVFAELKVDSHSDVTAAAIS